MALPTKLTREDVIELIIKMNQLNQREQAEVTYLRVNEAHPEWELNKAIREAMKEKS